jgi:hypothetical protein
MPCCARTPKCTGSREGGIAETYAPNRKQLIKRRICDSELVRHRIGEPERVAYGSAEIERLYIYRARCRPLLPLVWPANDRSTMGSDTPRSVRTAGATHRAVVPMTVMVRIWLANSHSPVRSHASRSVDAINTSGCMAWLGEHERAKCSHDGEHRYATSSEALCKKCHFGTSWSRGIRDYSTAC